MIYSGPKFDGPNIDYLSWLLARRGYHDDSEVFVDAADPANRISYAELVDLTKRLGQGLRELEGIGSHGAGKDVVLVYSENQIMFPVSALAIICAGGVYSAIGANIAPSDASYQVKLVRPKAIITSEKQYEAAKKTCELSGVPLSRIYVLNSKKGQHDIYNAESGISLIRNKQLEWERISDRSILTSRTACILFTSGTSGYPKGVELTHYNIVANIEQAFVMAFSETPYLDYQTNPDIFRDDQKVNAICHTPYSHVSGFGYYINVIMRSGGTSYIMSQLDVIALKRHIVEFPLTRIMTLPPIIHFLNNLNDPQIFRGLAKVREIFVGAAPMGSQLQLEFRNKLHQAAEKFGIEHRVRVVQIWGMTELAAAGLAFNLEVDPVVDGAVGRPFPGTQARLVDDDGNDVPPGTPGELLFKGDNVTKGYFENPKATAETFRDGWLCTGDVAVAASDGVFTILDRKKELLKYEGNQIAPAQVEALLNCHPEIIDSAVFGLPDGTDAGNDLPACYIVRKSPTFTAEDVKQYIRENASEFKEMRGGIFFVDRIQKNPTGKIMRKDIRAEALASLKKHVNGVSEMARM